MIISDSRLTGIYVIKCKVNGYAYIGSAAGQGGFCNRMRCHLSKLRLGKHHSYLLQRDFKRYGEEAFFVEILELCSSSNCLVIEQYYLEQLGVGEQNCSYNINPTSNSNLGRRWGEETRKKMSNASKGRKPSPEAIERVASFHRGRKRSLETRMKISAIHKGKTLTPEHRAKISRGNLGKKCSPESVEKRAAKRRGIPLSEEQKKRISATLTGQLGRPWTDETRAKMLDILSQEWLVTNPEGQTIRVKNLKSFCKQLGLDQGSMSRVGSGKLSSHKGWKCSKVQASTES